MSIDPGINEHEAYAVAEAFAAGRAMGHAEARDAVDGIEHWASYSPDGDVWECYASDPLAAIDAKLKEKP